MPVKQIVVTANTDQARAMIAKLAAGVKDFTEEEKKLIAAMQAANAATKQKEAAAKAAGVSVQELDAVVKQANATQFVRKKTLLDYADVLQASTGLQIANTGAIAETVSMFGPFGIAIAAAGLGIGLLVSEYKKWLAEHKEALQSLDTGAGTIIQFASQIEEKLTPALAANSVQWGSIVRAANEYQRIQLQEEIRKQKKEIEELNTEYERSITRLGPFMANTLQGAIYGKLFGISYDEAGQNLESFASKLEIARKELGLMFAAQAEGLSLQEKLRKEQDALSKQREEGERRRREAVAAAKREHDETVRFSSLTNTTYIEHRKKETEALAQEIVRRNRLRDREAAAAERKSQEEAEGQNQVRRTELQEGLRILLTMRRAKLRFRVQELMAERAAARRSVELAGATAVELIKFDKITHDMKVSMIIAEVALRVAAGAQIAGQLASAFGKHKAAAYASAIVSTAMAVAGALKTEPVFPLGFAMAIAAAVVGAAQIATISSTNMGQAHAGMDMVPREGSYILREREMVLDPASGDMARELVQIARMSTQGVQSSAGGRSGPTFIFRGTVAGGRQAAREIARAERRARKTLNVR